MIKSIFKTFVISLLMIANVHFAYAQTAALLPNAVQQFFTSQGTPLSSGTVTHYTPGTTVAKTVWHDAAETTPWPTTITLNAAGRPPNNNGIFGQGSYRQIVRDSANNIIWDQTTASSGSGGSSGSATVGDGQPVGSIQLWAGLVAPAAYAFAYGQEFTRAGFPELFAALSSQQNANCTLGSSTLSGLSDTQNLPIGAKIESVCLAAGATIVSKTISTVVASAAAIISTNTSARFFPYGNGDGSLTFNAPDLRGKVSVGRCNMGGIDCTNLNATYYGTSPSALGANGGSQSHTMTVAEIATHTPTTASIQQPTFSYLQFQVTGTGAAAGTGAGAPINYGGVTTAVLSTTNTAVTMNSIGSSTPFSTIQPSFTTNYVIKITPDSNPNSYFGVASVGGMTGVLICGTGISCSGNTITAISSITNIVDSITTYSNGNANGFVFNNSGIVATTSSVNNGIAITGSTGIPSVSTTIPTATQANITGTGILTSGSTGVGFTIALNSSTLTGAVPLARGGTNSDLSAATLGSIPYFTNTGFNILSATATARLPLLSGANVAPIWGAYTLPASVVSGGIACFTSTTTQLSSAIMTANAIMLGGGAGVCPSPMASLGTVTTVLHGNASGPPTFGAIALTTDVSGILPVANGGTNGNTASGTLLDNITGFSGTGYIRRTGAGTYTFNAAASTAQYYAGVATNVPVEPSVIYPVEVTTTFGATTTFDFSTFINSVVTLTGNITTQTLSNVIAGKAGTIVFVQDVTGSRTTVWNTIFKFAGGITPSLTTTANAVDVLTYTCRTTTFCVASLLKDVK